MSGESSSDCAYTVPYSALWKLGLTAFAEVSEALFVVEGREGKRAMGCVLMSFCLLALA